MATSVSSSVLLVLHPREKTILIELLEHARRELPIEIRHTDCREFREELRARLEHVESLLERIRG
jgi:hypothetical protein